MLLQNTVALDTFDVYADAACIVDRAVAEHAGAVCPDARLLHMLWTCAFAVSLHFIIKICKAVMAKN